MIEQEKPTLAGAVPTIWTALLDHLHNHPTDTSSLKEVVVGGSACPPALMHAFAERHGIEVIHAWGMTEMSPLGSVARPPARVEGPEAWAYRYTQGRIPAAIEPRIVGPAGEVMPNDGKAVGELEVRGPWITERYLGEAEPDPEKFDDGWLRTGDVGTLSADGYLTLSDRAKDVIKSGGEGISSGPAELRDFLADKMARWQLPERWAFIEAVPKTSVGKFDKKVVRAQYAEGALDVTQLA